MVLTPDGRYMIVITRTDLPKFAANSRDKGSADEHMANIRKRPSNTEANTNG
jgi:hypothetical protein